MPKLADSFSPERLQLFVAGLGGLAGPEIKKAKLLFLRNGLAEYQAAQDDLRQGRLGELLFWIVPLFWPLLISNHRSELVALDLRHRQLENAIEIWRDDLGGDGAAIASELERLKTARPHVLPWKR